MSGAGKIPSEARAPTLFATLVAHERGEALAGEAASPRPRLPYAFETAGTADPGLEIEQDFDPRPANPRSTEPLAGPSQPAAGYQTPVAAAGSGGPEAAERQPPARRAEVAAAAIAAAPRNDLPPPASEGAGAVPRDRPAGTTAPPSPRSAPSPEPAASALAVPATAPRPEEGLSRGPSMAAPAAVAAGRSDRSAPARPTPAIPAKRMSPLVRDEPVIEISIGRIDIRAVPGQPPPSAAQRPPAAPAADRLAEYLDRRSRGSRS